MFFLALFEDELATNFLPLSWTRPVWELRCGIFSLREAIAHAYKHKVDAFFVRDFLVDVVRERCPHSPVNEKLAEGMYLLLNGRLLAEVELPHHLPAEGEPCCYFTPGGQLLAARASAKTINAGWEAIQALPSQIVEWPLLEYSWQLFQKNGQRLSKQARQWELGNLSTAPYGVYWLGQEQIFVHPTARIMPGVVLDAFDGPIVIDANATIMANAVLQGPCYVGVGSLVKMAAKIYHHVTIGPVCKVGGEVEESIFQSYSNKQHDGFLGHAYLGSWCNLGADTNNSDLKNDYGEVSMWVNGHFQNTHSMFVGLVMGSHSKTGINTMFNTGTVVGVGCNIFGAGTPPKHIPSFSWGGGERWVDYRLEKALETAKRVMERRKITFSQAESQLLTHIYHATAKERGENEE